MEKKQTAVEWLEEQFEESYSYINEIFKDTFEQAKEMEKEQMSNMWIGGQWSVELGGKFEQYYNETFKSE